MNLETLQEKMLEQAEIHGDVEDLVNACAEIAHVEINKPSNQDVIRFARWCINVGYIPLENGSWGRAGYNPHYRLSDSEVLNQWNIYKKQNP